MLKSALTLSYDEERDLNRYMPPNSSLELMSDFFCVFCDPTRLKVISALSIMEMCVSDLVYILGLNQTTVSHQLKILKASNIVSSRRVGKIILYSIINPLVNDAMLVGANQVDLALNGNKTAV